MNIAIILTLITLLPLWLVPGPGRKGLLLAATLAFWMLASPAGLAWMLGMTCLAWAAARIGKSVAGWSVAVMVFALFLFKAGPVISSSPGSWLLPLGMSYYTFRTIGYVLDVKWGVGEALPFGDLLLFCGFFPAVLAGPVDRAGAFAGKVSALRSAAWNHARMRHGLFLIFCGTFSKYVLSGRLEKLVDAVFAAPETCGAFAASSAMLVFPWQLYYDFGGYTLMALGMGLLLGVRLPPNFNRPLLAPTVSEFWNRWHMSLTGWLRDYVYTPTRFLLRRHRIASIWTASVGTFMLCCLWHKVGSCFALLGLLIGVVVAAETLLIKRNAPATGWGHARTYGFLFLSLVLFRANDLPHAGKVFAALGRFKAADVQMVLDNINKLDMGVLVLGVAFFEWITAQGLLNPGGGDQVLGALSQGRRRFFYGVLVSGSLLLSQFEHTPFIYAQF